MQSVYGVPSSDSESSSINSAAVEYVPKEKKIKDILLEI
jgi:hypothetical protein